MNSKNLQVRLDSALIEEAAVEAAKQHRTISKQIEFWVSLGKIMDGVVSKEQAHCLRCGYLQIVELPRNRVTKSTIIAAIEKSRGSDERSSLVAYANVQYQASEEFPGCLEQVHADGLIVVGQFENGVFRPLNS